MTRRCLLVGLDVSAVWVYDCGRDGLKKMLAVKVTISTSKYMWSCHLRRCPLCKYVYTSQDDRDAVQVYVCSANMCVAKQKSFLRKRKWESQKLELIPNSETRKKGEESTPRKKNSLPSQDTCSNCAHS